MSACSSCRRPILWAKTTTGKAIPIDPTPVEGGNVDLSTDLLGELVASVVGVDVPGERHVSHFVTCPHAEQHRRVRP